MSPDYLALAAKRVATVWPPFQQPEDFGYDFRSWVSPYTKGANTIGGIAIVLQDWASADGLAEGPDPDVQRYGRTRSLLTNKRLEDALLAATGLSLQDVYATNAFPFIKPGGMSSGLRIKDITQAVQQFTKTELELARPTVVVSLGVLTHRALTRAGINSIHLPHPAARGMSGVDYVAMWCDAMDGHS